MQYDLYISSNVVSQWMRGLTFFSLVLMRLNIESDLTGSETCACCIVDHIGSFYRPLRHLHVHPVTCYMSFVLFLIVFRIWLLMKHEKPAVSCPCVHNHNCVQVFTISAHRRWSETWKSCLDAAISCFLSVNLGYSSKGGM